METSLLLLFGILLGSEQAPAAGAQAPGPPPGVEIVGFGFDRKSYSRLELTDVSTQPGRIATGGFRAEFGGEPAPGRQYAAYERRRGSTEYATFTVRNTGTKLVKTIDWEYVLPHFVKGKEVAWRSVRTKKTIPPGATLVLSQPLPFDNCRGGRYRSIYGIEQFARTCRSREKPKMTGWYRMGAAIRRIEYADGSVWRSP